MNISASPSIPSGGRYQVGSPLALACQALGGYSPLSYSWNSTCSGLCFVAGAMSSTISRSVLHSADAGAHTCSVTDYIGHTGSDSIQIRLTGTYNDNEAIHHHTYNIMIYFMCRCYSVL